MTTRWMIALYGAGLVFGQARVQIREVERIRPVADDPVPAILERLPRLTLGSLSDTAARAMLAVAASSSRRFLRWHLEDRTEAATLTEHDIDILVAHWADAAIDGVHAEAWIW